jgi:hypothetical protein
MKQNEPPIPPIFFHNPVPWPVGYVTNPIRSYLHLATSFAYQLIVYVAVGLRTHKNFLCVNRNTKTESSAIAYAN